MTRKSVLLITGDTDLENFLTEVLSGISADCETLGSGRADDERRVSPSSIVACRAADVIVVDFKSTAFKAEVVTTRLRTLVPNKTFLLLHADEHAKAQAEKLGFDAACLVDDGFDEKSFLAALEQAEPPSEMIVITEHPTEQAAEGAEPMVPATVAERADAPLAARGRVITVANLKGGSGKSTLAMHLITSLMDAGVAVASLDLDHPQETLTKFLSHRSKRRQTHDRSLLVPYHHVIAGADDKPHAVEAMIGNALRDWDCVVVDTAAGFSQATRAALVCTDILITPINDSFVDLDVIASLDVEDGHMTALGPFGEMVKEARERRKNMVGKDRRIDWLLVRNRLTQLRSRDKTALSEGIARLGEELGFQEIQGLSERVIYRELFRKGLTLVDLREGDCEVSWSMSHVAARQELRLLLESLDIEKIKAEAAELLAS